MYNSTSIVSSTTATLYARDNGSSSRHSCFTMASDLAEYCLHVRQLQTKIARCAIWINIPAALLTFILVRTNDVVVLPIHIRRWPASWTFSLTWLFVSGLPLMLLAVLLGKVLEHFRKRCLRNSERQVSERCEAESVNGQQTCCQKRIRYRRLTTINHGRTSPQKSSDRGGKLCRR